MLFGGFELSKKNNIDETYATWVTPSYSRAVEKLLTEPKVVSRGAENIFERKMTEEVTKEEVKDEPMEPEGENKIIKLFDFEFFTKNFLVIFWRFYSTFLLELLQFL